MKIFTEQSVRVELIEEYCVKNNLSKKELCHKCGIALQALQKINHRNYKYRIEAITKIAETMGVDVGDLYVNE